MLCLYIYSCQLGYLSLVSCDSTFNWWYFWAVSDGVHKWKRLHCVCTTSITIFPFRLRGSASLVELHTHYEAPKRGAFTTGKKSRDKYLVLIATVLSLPPPHAHVVSVTFSLEKEPWRQSDPKHTKMSTVKAAQALFYQLQMRRYICNDWSPQVKRFD